MPYHEQIRWLVLFYMVWFTVSLFLIPPSIYRVISASSFWRLVFAVGMTSLSVAIFNRLLHCLF
jgi:hypothetical protein